MSLDGALDRAGGVRDGRGTRHNAVTHVAAVILALVVLDSTTATINGATRSRTTHVISLPETHWTFFCRHGRGNM